MYGPYDGGESLYCARASAKSDAGISLPEILVVLKIITQWRLSHDYKP